MTEYGFREEQNYNTQYQKNNHSANTWNNHDSCCNVNSFKQSAQSFNHISYGRLNILRKFERHDERKE